MRVLRACRPVAPRAVFGPLAGRGRSGAVGLVFCTSMISFWAAAFIFVSNRTIQSLNMTWKKTSGMAVIRPIAVANRASPMAPAWLVDAARVAALGLRDRVERVDHRDDGAEQPDHRGDLGDRQDRGEQEVQPREDLQFDGAGHAPPHGGGALLGGLQPGDEEHLRDQPLLLAAQGDGPVGRPCA